MTVLVELYPTGEPEEISAESVFSRVRNQYFEEVHSPDAYLKDSFEVTFGKDEPQRVIDTVRGWNPDILEDFKRAIDVFQKLMEEKGTEAFDTPESYAVKCTALEIDNSFYDYAEKAVYALADGYFTVVISDVILGAVVKEPERFALIEVWAK